MVLLMVLQWWVRLQKLSKPLCSTEDALSRGIRTQLPILQSSPRKGETDV